jgi:hypothetical protein
MGEPFMKALTRTTLLAGALGLVFLVLLPRHASLASDYVDTFTVAFCFTFLGYYVDRGWAVVLRHRALAVDTLRAGSR